MSKAPSKFPKVFLACPFDKDMPRLLDELYWLPWRIQTANARVTSDHLLAKITDDLNACDFAVFDISGWNPNVCLELGLAKGLGKAYYIINNNSKKKDAPSDIKGIERVDFNWNKKKKASSLFDHLKDGIFKKKYVTKKLWQSISHSINSDKKFTVILYALVEFREGRPQLTMSDFKQLAKGLNIKKESDYEDIIKALVSTGCCKKVQRSGAITLKKKLFK
jgi:hypothetical protein